MDCPISQAERGIVEVISENEKMKLDRNYNKKYPSLFKHITDYERISHSSGPSRRAMSSDGVQRQYA